MDDTVEIKTFEIYKKFRIHAQRLYPVFTGWYCHLYRLNKKHMCYHTSWTTHRDNAFSTKEAAIKAAKDDIDNIEGNFITDPWF